MRKFLVISIPIFALLTFVLIMLSGDFLKRPLGKDDDIPKIVQTLIGNIKAEEWEQASNNTKKLSSTWGKIVKRVQFSSERDEINAFSANLARLKGALLVKDKSSSLSEICEAYEHWKELGK